MRSRVVSPASWAYIGSLLLSLSQAAFVDPPPMSGAFDYVGNQFIPIGKPFDIKWDGTSADGKELELYIIRDATGGDSGRCKFQNNVFCPKIASGTDLKNMHFNWTVNVKDTGASQLPDVFHFRMNVGGTDDADKNFQSHYFYVNREGVVPVNGPSPTLPGSAATVTVTATPTPDSGLDTGSKVAIGVGAGAGVILVIMALIITYLRRALSRAEHSEPMRTKLMRWDQEQVLGGSEPKYAPIGQTSVYAPGRHELDQPPRPLYQPPAQLP